MILFAFILSCPNVQMEDIGGKDDDGDGERASRRREMKDGWIKGILV